MCEHERGEGGFLNSFAVLRFFLQRGIGFQIVLSGFASGIRTGGGGDSDLQLGAIFGCKGAWSGWCDGDKWARKMINKASSSTDYKKRHDIFAQIAKRMTNELAVIPLYRLNATFGLSNRGNWDPRVDERVMAWEIPMK